GRRQQAVRRRRGCGIHGEELKGRHMNQGGTTMAIVRWEPFRDLLSLQERMNRLFDESFRGTRGSDEDWALGGSWAPAVDIYEQDGNIVLKAELPGVDPKDVDVRVENNLLTLRGERKFDNEVKRDSY